MGSIFFTLSFIFIFTNHQTLGYFDYHSINIQGPPGDGYMLCQVVQSGNNDVGYEDNYSDDYDSGFNPGQQETGMNGGGGSDGEY